MKERILSTIGEILLIILALYLIAGAIIGGGFLWCTIFPISLICGNILSAFTIIALVVFGIYFIAEFEEFFDE